MFSFLALCVVLWALYDQNQTLKEIRFYNLQHGGHEEPESQGSIAPDYFRKDT